MTTKTKPISAPAKPLRAYSPQEFADADFSLTWLVEGVLVAKQPAVIGGPPKSLKTSTALDLAISLGTATPFLGNFKVPKKVSVGVISGESGDASVRETAKRICQAKGVDLASCGVHWSFHLPQLSKAGGRESLRHFIEQRKLKVVVLDPLYLCLLSAGMGAMASNLYEMGSAIKNAAQVCKRAGATPVFVHHTLKSSGSKAEHVGLNDLAFAGIAEFVRQWVLLGHRVPFDPLKGYHDLVMTIGGSVGHADRWRLIVTEGVLARDFSGRKWSVAFTKDDIDKPKKRTKDEESNERPFPLL